MKKCKYCGNELNSNSEFCSNKCESSYKEAVEKDNPKIKYFILGMQLSCSRVPGGYLRRKCSM